MRRKTVVVLESGRIPELNICGPIQTPTRIGIKNIAMMVKNGKNVLECDPKDPHNQDKRIKLTVENVGKENFGGSEVKPAVEPAKVEEKKADEQATTPTTDQKKQETATPEAKPVVEPAKVEKTEEKKADEQAAAPTTDQKKQESNKEKNKGKK